MKAHSRSVLFPGWSSRGTEASPAEFSKLPISVTIGLETLCQSASTHLVMIQ